MSGPVEPPTNEQRVLRGFRIVTSSRGGLFTDGVRLGDEVRAGGLLARVIDPYGVVVEEIRAPVSGIILTVPVNPAAGTGTWAFEIGW
jgi:predicted deacylase